MEEKALIDAYFDQMKTAAEAVSREDLAMAIDLLFGAWLRGSRVFVCGNGGSASTATHLACDLAKSTVLAGRRRFKVIGLNDNIPLNSAIINDEGFERLFCEQMLNLFEAGDVLVCLSVHGGAGSDRAGLWSQNLLRAMRLARELGGKTIGLSGFDGGPMVELADACVVVPVASTPHVESLHLAIGHLICGCLRHRIEGEQ